MKFLLDESAEYRIAAFLKDQGHDVTAIAHDYPQALTDSDVLAIAEAEGRVMITNDLDFGELVFRDGKVHAGVILFRLPSGGTEAQDRRPRAAARFPCRRARSVHRRRSSRHTGPPNFNDQVVITANEGSPTSDSDSTPDALRQRVLHDIEAVRNRRIHPPPNHLPQPLLIVDRPRRHHRHLTLQRPHRRRVQ